MPDSNGSNVARVSLPAAIFMKKLSGAMLTIIAMAAKVGEVTIKFPEGAPGDLARSDALKKLQEKGLSVRMANKTLFVNVAEGEKKKKKNK